MACSCEGPCAPQPFRCACERDCWTGPPDDYDACLAACDPTCGFPRVEGLPSAGYRCEGFPTSDYTDCSSVCTTARTDSTDLCDTDRTTCEGTCSGLADEAAAACFESCASNYCQCTGEAQTAYLHCVFPCDRDIAFPAAFVCLSASIESDRVCCGTDRSDALHACESAYLTAAETIEQTWLACVDASLPASAFRFENGICNTSGVRSYSCAADRLTAMSAIELTRAECTAGADEAERRRSDPDERKFSECGMRQLCEDKCEAAADAAVAACGVTFLGCAGACDALTTPEAVAACRAACATAYRECWTPADVARVSCRVECCKTNNPHAPNDHARADCRFDCYEDFLTAKVTCSDAFAQCRDACDDGDTTCHDACETTFCACKGSAITGHDVCLADCETDHRGDCPSCYNSALEAEATGTPLYTVGITIPDPLPSVPCV